MQMTDNEIYRNYKEAKKPAEQIQILADMNSCSAAKIKAIIESEKRKNNTEIESKKVGRAAMLSDAEKDKIWELHCGGANIPEIVRQVGRTYDTIKKYINKEQEKMLFTEELTAREREVLTEITENLDKPAEPTLEKQLDELSREIDELGEEIMSGVTSVEIAKGLMAMLFEEFSGYRITIERTDSGYIVDVQDDKDGATLRRSFNG